MAELVVLAVVVTERETAVVADLTLGRSGGAGRPADLGGVVVLAF